MAVADVRIHLYTSKKDLEKCLIGEDFFAWGKEWWEEGDVHIDVDIESILSIPKDESTSYLVRGKCNRKEFNRLK